MGERAGAARFRKAEANIYSVPVTVSWKNCPNRRWRVSRNAIGPSRRSTNTVRSNPSCIPARLRYDSFTVKPVSDVIMNMELSISDESKLAMAAVQNGGESDNRNGQKMLDLQNSKVVGGNKTFNDAYASLVSTVGSTTASLKVSSQTKANVETQLIKQQQTISGVNLDEEYGNLQRYQQYYLANAQVLQTASTLFDAIINIR